MSKRRRVILGRMIILLVFPFLACATVFWIYPWATGLIHQDEVEAIEERYLIASSLAYSRRSDRVYQYTSPDYRADHTLDELEHSGFFYSLRDRFRLVTIDFNLSGKEARIFTGRPGSLLEFKLPGGNEFWLVKLDGNWYFTGRSVRHID